MQSYLSFLVPGIVSTISVAGPDIINQSTTDGIRSVEYNLTNFNLTDITVGKGSISISISPPYTVKAYINGFSSKLYYNFSETGFALEKNGTAITEISKTDMTIELLLLVLNGKISVQSVSTAFSIKINSVTTNSKKMSDSFKKKINSVITTYLNSATFASVLPNQIQYFISAFLSNLTYNVYLPSTQIYIDSHVLSNIATTSTYVSYPINGTICSPNSLPSTLTLPTDLTTVPINVNNSESQVIISQYTLNTFFTALLAQNTSLNVTKLPSYFPSFLTTNNSYFSELQAKYPNSKLYLILKYTSAPELFMLSSGILLRSSIQFSLNVITNQSSVLVNTFTVVVDYQCQATVSFRYVVGQCARPMISTITQQGNIAISVFNLARFAFDFFEALFFYDYTRYMFPVIPLHYPQGTLLRPLSVSYGSDYLVLEYIANYPNLA